MDSQRQTEKNGQHQCHVTVTSSQDDNQETTKNTENELVK